MCWSPTGTKTQQKLIFNMRNYFLITFTAFALNALLAPLAFGQNSTFRDRLTLGVKAGFNWTSSNDEDRVQDNKVKPRPGFHVGGLAHYHLADNWALQTELTYSKEGALYDFKGSKTIAPYEGKTDLNFLNVPLLVQYMFGSSFRIQTGPQLGYALSIKYEDPYNEESEKNDIQKVNLSWSVGFGYLTKSGIGFDARYNAGLSNVYKEGFYPDQSARTRAGQIGVFYQFK
ncbi:outer membrane beta-barrel protein [Nibribacter ruber]|uniref:Outer membrane beta-barrel protein n=1 Tax=Nibribacter ruber TaxID=2698458 RepID=A0A6P1NX88_9BACT|nr:porin family protein [Nibribacter ruber]QHL86261.1 outer membrane beta-barrel protein [Nibribacter ruber]